LDLRLPHQRTLHAEDEPLHRDNLDEFIARCHAENRHEHKEMELFHGFDYDDPVKRDKTRLDIFWLKDDSMEDAANLPAPDVIAPEIVKDLQAAPAS
jgi:type I restriction enzyme M protein